MKRTLITSALPYANGYLHLGHCAGAYLPADIYARFLRLNGEEVIWICGSDEHGVAITIAAEKEKVAPKAIIDKYHEANKSAFEKFGMSFDIYSRTSNPSHHDTAREFFGDFLSKGLLIEREEAQFYDEKAAMFLPDRYVEGICPNCGFDKARGDQCDSCGAYYNQIELKSPKSLVSGDTPVAKRTTHWYMRFDYFQKFLEEYIESHANDWKDNVLQQTRSWLKQGLAERAITRDLNWGVPIEGIQGIDSAKAKGKVIYVWFEAVLGYISATKELLSLSDNADEWKKWWQDDNTKYVAFIGKDNIVFHTLIFPALLHGRGGYILPANVPANEFLNLEGQKFSKSRNWSIDLRDFIEDFPSAENIDALRFTLAVNFPETRDSDFTWKDYQARTNNELADILGNFVNRTVQFTYKNFEGALPELTGNFADLENEWNKAMIALSQGSKIESPLLNSNDEFLLTSAFQSLQNVNDNFRKFRFREGITEIMNIARYANKYFNDEAPWKTAKSNPEHCGKTIFICLNLVRELSVLIAPVLPNTAKSIARMLNVGAISGERADGINNWSKLLNFSLKQNHKLSNPEILFHKVEDEVIARQVAKLGNKQNANAEIAEMAQIDIEYFSKIQLRTAKVIHAERVPKSKKLLKLIVDIGGSERQILAGIAEHYSPDDMIGKTVVVVANLKPAKLMGLESQGMLLAANTSDGKLSVVSPDALDVEIGAVVR